MKSYNPPNLHFSIKIDLLKESIIFPPMGVIAGKEISQSFLSQSHLLVQKFLEEGVVPCLAVILVGEDPASQVYVANKIQTCKDLQIKSRPFYLSNSITQEELLKIIEELNEDLLVHGILVQLPLPSQVRSEAIIEKIHPLKDVDGFHPQNVARLARGEIDGFIPCTPLGCLRLLEFENIKVEGEEIVILGRSSIVGKPLALLLMSPHCNATVTLAHSQTKNLREVCRRADILVTAMGKPNTIDASFLKEGVVVLDVGITRIEKDQTSFLSGDVCFEEVKEICSKITPVPGGVGPMTIAMLMENTLKAVKLLK